MVRSQRGQGLAFVSRCRGNMEAIAYSSYIERRDTCPCPGHWTVWLSDG